MAERVRRGSTYGFGLWLVPSREDPERRSIESAGRISRSAALRTLRTFGLAPAVLSALPESLLDRGDLGRDGRSGAAARIEVVRLTPRQARDMFCAVRERDASVRELYWRFRERGFVPVGERARGTVMRTYSAAGVPGAGGAVMALPHRGLDGELVWFHVSTRDATEGGRDCVPGSVSATYSIRCGARIETRAVRGESAPDGPRAATPRRSQTPGR